MVSTEALRCRYQLPELFLCCSVFGSVPIQHQDKSFYDFIFFKDKEKKNKVDS
jgi:hypothetical protein